MIMKKLIRTLLCCLLFLLSTGMYAQKGLQIASVFQKYGNEKGATYVELSKSCVPAIPISNNSPAAIPPVI